LRDPTAINWQRCASNLSGRFRAEESRDRPNLFRRSEFMRWLLFRQQPFRTMSAPAAARARAMPRPMPLVDPVTTADLPVNTIFDAPSALVGAMGASEQACALV
jgi:hypothetical protein